MKQVAAFRRRESCALFTFVLLNNCQHLYSDVRVYAIHQDLQNTCHVPSAMLLQTLTSATADHAHVIVTVLIWLAASPVAVMRDSSSSKTSAVASTFILSMTARQQVYYDNKY